MHSTVMWLATICSNLIIIFINALPSQRNPPSQLCFPCLKKPPESPPETEVVTYSKPKFVQSQSIETTSAVETARVDTSTWTPLHKQYWNYFGNNKKDAKGVALTHWRVMYVLKQYTDLLPQMCEAAFVVSKNLEIPPNMKSLETLTWCRLGLGSDSPMYWKSSNPPTVRIDILRCAKNQWGEIFITKGRSDNSVYFVKPVNPRNLSDYFMLDENYEQDVDLGKNFLQAAKEAVEREGWTW